MKIWGHKYNLIRLTWEAFFCEYKKNGSKEFSTKKFFAFIFASLLGIVNHSWLLFWPESHWVAVLTQNGVSENIQSVIIGSGDALVIGALTVYGWAKTKGGA